MEPSGALSELGLTVPTSADAIRRAYLRGVRAHPPERDPEGFRKIRAAYELLKDAPWLWVEDNGSSSSEDDAEDDDAEDEEDDNEGNDESDPAADAESAEARAPAPASASADESFEPVEVFPEASEPSPLQTLSETLAKKDYERAAELISDALGAEGVGDDTAQFVFPWHVVQAAVGLFKQGKLAPAGSLLTCYDEWVTRRGILPNGFNSEFTARLALLGELRELTGHADPYIIQALARAIDESQFHSVRSLLERAARGDERLEFSFRKRAPLLYDAAWPKRVEVGVQSAPDFRGGYSFSWWNVAWIVFVFANAIRVCSTGSLSGRHDSESKKPFVTAANGETYFERQFERASAAIDASLRQGDCASVREQWSLFVQAGHKAYESGAFAKMAEDRRASVLAMCPELSVELK